MSNVVIGLHWFFIIVVVQICIFFLDVEIVEDDVSIGFLYTLPTLMGFFVKDRILRFTIVGISVILIVVGCFIPPPVRDDLPVFLTNRFLSVITVLITGVMVYIRARLEATLGEALAAEKNVSATQRAFVSMVSHEFRTPLAVINSEAERLINTKDRISPGEIKGRATVIREAVAQMITLIESVLYSSRAQENKIVLNVGRVELPALLKKVCQQRAVAARSHSIECHLSDFPLMINGDSNLLNYVIDKLVANAVKYSQPGTTVTVTGTTEGGFAVITVRDRGIGIPQEDLPRLFEPYFRAGNAVGFRGCGVGLYLVRTFVRLHGGQVSVSSELHHGSVFVVRLPLYGISPEAPDALEVNGEGV